MFDIFDLNDLLLSCSSELNYLCSFLQDNVLQEKLHILTENKKEESFYKFLNFKNALDDYRFGLQLFNQNKEWNFEKGLTRNMLENTSISRKRALKALKNIKSIINKTIFVDFKDDLKNSIDIFKDSVNDEIIKIQEYLKRKCSQKEFENIINLYDLNLLD